LRRNHGQRGHLLNRARPETRGVIGIGFLVVALIAGGLTSSNRLHSLIQPAPPPVVEPQVSIEPEIDTTPSLLQPLLQLAEGIENSASGLQPIGGLDEAWITHYGESFNGQAMGCDGTPYSSADASIAAVAPSRNADWPCGTLLRICGSGGCTLVQRSDGCPGCGPNHVDLSEQGLRLVCGPGTGVCKASVEAFELACVQPNRAIAGSGPLELFATLAEAALDDRTASLLDLSRDDVDAAICTAHVMSEPAPVLFQ
jgi:hypothetical protein